MSHFTVIVFGDDVVEKLEPYWELDLSQDEMKEDERAVFQDETEKVKKRFEEEIQEMVVLPNGKRVFSWEDKNNEAVETVKIKTSEIYKDWKEFAKEWFDYVIDGDCCGYYSNPNAQWDWYVVGGRWRGFFIHKKNPQYPDDIVLKSNASLFSSDELKCHKRACDIIRKCDIDIETMQRIAVERAEESWKLARGNKQQQFIHGVEEGITLREHLEGVRKGALVPFAMIDMDGNWHEKGNMGWFGISTNEKDDWNSIFMEYFNSVPEETLLTLVDCHI